MRTCHLREIDLCVATLVLNGNSNPGSYIPVTDDQLTKTCKNVRESQQCLVNFTKRCGSKVQREQIKWMTQNAFNQFNKICTRGHRDRKEFLKHAPCYNQASNNRNGCFTDFRNALEKLMATKYDNRISGGCCSYKQFQSCAIKSIEKACGKSAAQFGMKLIRKITTKMPDVICHGTN